jgi:DNA-binding GntR family transcriptional regulator
MARVEYDDLQALAEKYGALVLDEEELNGLRAAVNALEQAVAKGDWNGSLEYVRMVKEVLGL